MVNAWFSVDGFQSTLPREERRTRSYQLRSTPKYFNPRSHERSDIEDQQARKLGIRFQSTLPREERPQETRMSDIHSNFNPRSHERSDSNIKTPRRQKRISIHAPTRGATTTSQTSCIKALDFNPRSHERSDVALYVSCILVAVISIHAPTRGATGKRYIRRML